MDRIKIFYPQWAEFHRKIGSGEFKHQRYGQAFHNFFNLPVDDVELNSIFYADEDKAYHIITDRIVIAEGIQKKDLRPWMFTESEWENKYSNIYYDDNIPDNEWIEITNDNEEK